MLSISKPIYGKQGADYYLQLSGEDYYLEGLEPKGYWIGTGAYHLRLKGEIRAELFRKVFDGFSPIGDTALVQNAGSPERPCAWDLTFSAPKSVSVFWSQSDAATRSLVEDAQKRAVEDALNYLEEHAAFTRRGSAGKVREATNLVGAGFEHSTSREQDPHRHTHLLVLNLGIRQDETTGSITSKSFFDHKMAAGAIYRATLAAELAKTLGLQIESCQDKTFRISGVSEELCREFSKRAEQIRSAMAERNVSGPVAASIATLDTRKEKVTIGREELFQNWRKVGEEIGWGERQAQELCGKVQSSALTPNPEAALRAAIAEIAAERSHFSRLELTTALGEVAPAFNLSGKDVAAAVLDRLQRADVVETLDGGKTYTTHDLLLLREFESRREHGPQQKPDEQFPFWDLPVDEKLKVLGELRAALHAHADPDAGGKGITASEITPDPSLVFSLGGVELRVQHRSIFPTATSLPHLELQLPALSLFASHGDTAITREEKVLFDWGLRLVAVSNRKETQISRDQANDRAPFLEAGGVEVGMQSQSLFPTKTRLPHLEIQIPFLEIKRPDQESSSVGDRKSETVLLEKMGLKLVFVYWESDRKQVERIQKEREERAREEAEKEKRRMEEQREAERKEREERERRRREEQERQRQAAAQQQQHSL